MIEIAVRKLFRDNYKDKKKIILLWRIIFFPTQQKLT